MSVTKQEPAGSERPGSGHTASAAMLGVAKEPAGSERLDKLDPDRWEALVQEAFEAEGVSEYRHVWDELLRRERRMRMEEERRKTDREMDNEMHEVIGEEMDKEMHEVIGEEMDRRMDRRMDERIRKEMERRLDQYIQVGIHRDFARDYARYMARVSC